MQTATKHSGFWLPSDTAREMKLLALRHQNDVARYASLTLPEFYGYVKSIPYRRDPIDIEVLQRPSITINRSGPGGDCDDKSIIMMAYCNLKKIPFKIIAIGNKEKGLCHVMLRVYYGGRWMDCDPTYSYGTFGRRVAGYELEKVIG